eukprot:m.5161 g.5161  ORF g.5161 m.5161 type:complete len:344 (-) comp2350_c0_seq1:53-1084(-)
MSSQHHQSQMYANHHAYNQQGELSDAREEFDKQQWKHQMHLARSPSPLSKMAITVRGTSPSTAMPSLHRDDESGSSLVSALLSEEKGDSGKAQSSSKLQHYVSHSLHQSRSASSPKLLQQPHRTPGRLSSSFTRIPQISISDLRESAKSGQAPVPRKKKIIPPKPCLPPLAEQEGFDRCKSILRSRAFRDDKYRKYCRVLLTEQFEVIPLVGTDLPGGYNVDHIMDLETVSRAFYRAFKYNTLEFSVDVGFTLNKIMNGANNLCAISASLNMRKGGDIENYPGNKDEEVKKYLENESIRSMASSLKMQLEAIYPKFSEALMCLFRMRHGLRHSWPNNVQISTI